VACRRDCDFDVVCSRLVFDGGTVSFKVHAWIDCRSSGRRHPDDSLVACDQSNSLDGQVIGLWNLLYNRSDDDNGRRENFPVIGLILYALPVVLTLWVSWLVLTQRVAWPTRRAGTLLIIVATGSIFRCFV